MKRILIIWALLISVVFAQSKAGFYVVGGKVITVQDTSSRKYLKAVENAGVTPTTNQNFTSNYLVTTQKEIGVWSLMVAQYPFIGGTAATHKFNMKDPRDLDAAFRLSFPNGMTHDSFGITGNGTNQYAKTFLIPNTSLSASSNHLSAYVTKNVGDGLARYVFGAGNFGSSNILAMYIRKTTIQAYLATNPSTIDAKVYTNNIADLKGYYFGNNLSNALSIRKNGDELANNTSNLNGSFNGLPTFDLVIMARQSSMGAFGDYDNKSLGLATIGDGFTTTQIQQQSHIVTFTQSLLARQ